MLLFFLTKMQRSFVLDKFIYILNSNCYVVSLYLCDIETNEL